MPRIQVNWVDVLGSCNSSPDCADAFCPAPAPAPRRAAARTPVQIDWLEVFGGCSSSPDRADAFHPASAPAPWRVAAAGGRRRPRVVPAPRRAAAAGGRRRCLRAVPEAAAHRPSVDAPAKEDGREGEGITAPAAKRSHQIDVEKEDALLHMLGAINKSLQAYLKSPEPQQVPKDASPEEIFEALGGIPRLARADRLRAYSLLTQDDRRFRSLMALPKNMRKEWLLMEIRSI